MDSSPRPCGEWVTGGEPPSRGPAFCQQAWSAGRTRPGPALGTVVTVAYMRPANFPVRFAAGVMILSAGVGKLRRTENGVPDVHAVAATNYPFLEQMAPEQFTKVLGVTEMVLGGALLVPLVGDGVAGVGLSAFAAAMIGLFAKGQGEHHEGPAPEHPGAALARDIWLLGIGLRLVADSLRRRQRIWTTTP
jgi:hypothetical protein